MGSSPRVWGQVLDLLKHLLDRRIIPTRVGTRRQTRDVKAVDEDHPHACGDKNITIMNRTLNPGSSPRVWGQVLDLLKHLLDRRIIPTRVGTRRQTRDVKAVDEDHPHACGDKNITIMNRTLNPGSSPRVWGQDDIFSCADNTIRSIPTRVGTRNVTLLSFINC